MNPNTYLVDPQDLSPIGKSIKSLHHEFQIPSLIKLQEALRNDSNKTIEKIKSEPDILISLIDILPQQNQPEALRALKDWEFVREDAEYLDNNNKINHYTFDKEETNYLIETAKSQNIESVAAKVLLAMGEENITKEGLKAKLSNAIEVYKLNLKTQTDKDIGRTTYLLKEKDGQVKVVTEIDKLNLSGEQKAFIKAACHQGTFSMGYIAAGLPYKKLADTDMTFDFGARYPLLIDLSDDKVKLYPGSVDISTKDIETMVPHSKATLEVDISNLGGDQYIPVISPNIPKIRALITEFDANLPLGAKGPKVDSTLHDYVRENCITGELNAIIRELDPEHNIMKMLKSQLAFDNNSVNMAAIILDSQEPDEMKKKLGILKEIIGEESMVSITKEHPYLLEEGYYKIQDPVERAQFAIDKSKIGLFIDKEVLIDIMKPLCKDEQEKNILQHNSQSLDLVKYLEIKGIKVDKDMVIISPTGSKHELTSKELIGFIHKVTGIPEGGKFSYGITGRLKEVVNQRLEGEGLKKVSNLKNLILNKQDIKNLANVLQKEIAVKNPKHQKMNESELSNFSDLIMKQLQDNRTNSKSQKEFSVDDIKNTLSKHIPGNVFSKIKEFFNKVASLFDEKLISTKIERNKNMRECSRAVR